MNVQLRPASAAQAVTRLAIITPEQLSANRRYAVLVIAVAVLVVAVRMVLAIVFVLVTVVVLVTTGLEEVRFVLQNAHKVTSSRNLTVQEDLLRNI